MKSKLTRWGAWLVTVALLAYLFWRTPVGEVVAAAREAASWTVPVAIVGVLLIYLCDSLATWKTFEWFLARLSFAEVLVLRGGTYLLAVINYNVGQAAIVYFVHRATGAPVMRGIATFLLILGTNLLALLFLASAGLALAPEIPQVVPTLTLLAYAGLAVYAVVVAVRPRWLAARPVFDVLLQAGFAGHARTLLVRLPHVAALIAYHTAMLHAFRVAVPPSQAIVALPAVFIVAVLPISVQGLGIMQAAMVFFFARYAPGGAESGKATVLAASLVAQALATAVQAALGIVCLRTRIGRELRAAALSAKATSATPSTDAST
jgi:hypothetical protein